jgi:alpha-D-xyloside xylohydrolase
MKFRDGYWGLKPGIALNRHLDVREVRAGEDSLAVFASARTVNHRGDTLNIAMLTTELTAPAPGIIRVRTYHHKGALDLPPHFEIRTESRSVQVEQNSQVAKLRSGGLVAEVAGGGERDIRFLWDGKYLTRAIARLSGHVSFPDGTCRMTEYLGLSVGEHVYGLGERFTPFVKNGQVVDVWNEDGGTASEQAYKNIPFYLTDRGYGVFVANPATFLLRLGRRWLRRCSSLCPASSWTTT